MATKRLGRGINALIRETTDESARTYPIFHVSLKLVSPNPHQPRQKFDEKSDFFETSELFEGELCLMKCES